MNTQEQTRILPSTEFSIHPRTRLGQVSLTVADLDAQVAFYVQTLGMTLHWRDGDRAGLGVGGADLLRLTRRPGARRVHHVTGLYHFALVFPGRRELAHAVARLFALKVRNYPTDHIMTKSTYLNDPEGNGIELYAESPEDGMFVFEGGDFVTRRADGSLSDGREPLDLEALFSHLTPEDRLENPLSRGTRLGHMHLHVSDLDEAVAFYHGLLGFDVMGISKSFQAAFVSAGGYHHHIGLNTWQGVGAPPPPPGAVGLEDFTVVLPEEAAFEEEYARIAEAGIQVEPVENGVRLWYPSQNGVVITWRGR